VGAIGKIHRGARGERGEGASRAIRSGILPGDVLDRHSAEGARSARLVSVVRVMHVDRPDGAARIDGAFPWRFVALGLFDDKRPERRGHRQIGLGFQLRPAAIAG